MQIYHKLSYVALGVAFCLKLIDNTLTKLTYEYVLQHPETGFLEHNPLYFFLRNVGGDALIYGLTVVEFAVVALLMHKAFNSGKGILPEEVGGWAVFCLIMVLVAFFGLIDYNNYCQSIAIGMFGGG